MIRVNVLYPYREGARFDADYYAKTHMDMVREAFGSHGLVSITVERGLVGGQPKSPPLYVGIGRLDFETMDGYKAAFREHGERLLADVPNFTDIQPLVQVSEVVL